MHIKRQNKEKLYWWVKDKCGIDLNIDSLFDIQVSLEFGCGELDRRLSKRNKGIYFIFFYCCCLLGEEDTRIQTIIDEYLVCNQEIS